MSVTFQPPSKSFTARDYQFIALVSIVVVAISIGLVMLNLTLKDGGDFYVHWFAVRVFQNDRLDPYSGEVPARVQQQVYGGPAAQGDEPYILDTPFHILLLYFPLTLLSDPLLARAIFTLILQLALFALAFISLRLTEWEVPIIFYVLFPLLAIFNFYTFQAIYEASPVLLLGLTYAEILIALRADLDEVAGALAAVSLYYWEVGAPFLVLVALRVYYEKRTRVFAGFAMASLILLVLSFMAYPNWFIPFLRATVNNIKADFGFNVHSIFIRIWPAFGGTFAWLFIGLLVVALGYEWSAARSGDFRRFYWAACLSIAAAPLLGFRTEMENLAVLIIPLALIFAIVHDRWYKIGNFLTILLMLLVGTLPWAVSLFLVPRFGIKAEEGLFLFLPLFTFIGLYWIRWWAIRPPRILSDIASRL
ncbi:MAG TPA: hypothetical protein PKE35_10210 [Anaerolineales bacterium]|nr:hypothetical protein [Anaerolineales bacterium]HMV97799.1 hypothetical protein [Anaerolineales bacterium]HMX74619.1 hypothetical protein [Anaerolineales bacterium]HMZ43390.1 hypothetical protein [Anaerolineales bacterium]HND92309.1 hypothetical protein [Anaerolineales bacterium]